MALKKCKECGEEISKKADKCPKCGAPQGAKQYSIGKLLVLIVFGAFMYSLFSGNSGTGSASRTPSPKQTAMKNVKLDFSWAKEGFGNVMEANFTIINNSEHQIKDIEITCTHYAKSGTRIDSNERTIYDVVPANSKKTIENFNMGFIHSQAEKTSCAITDLKI